MQCPGFSSPETMDGKMNRGKCGVGAYFFNELNTELPCDPAIPQPGIYRKEWKAGTQTFVHKYP